MPLTHVLVAGVGNVFLNDDGFGVEVVRRLAQRDLPPNTVVADYGVRGVHLAFELLSTPRLLVLVDTISRGRSPGTLYVVDPELDESLSAPPDAHAMDPRSVLDAVRQMGGVVPRTLIVGCEPESLDEGMTLSVPVREAIEPAIGMITQLIAREDATC